MDNDEKTISKQNNYIFMMFLNSNNEPIGFFTKKMFPNTKSTKLTQFR